MDAASLVKLEPNPNVPELSPGDSVEVSYRVVEAQRERTQVLRGVVIRESRGGPAASFTIRRISHGVGVEQTFPLHSPRLEKVVITRRGKVRRAKLYYLRGLSAKKARIRKTRRV